jgi:hypothetical protein
MSYHGGETCTFVLMYCTDFVNMLCSPGYNFVLLLCCIAISPAQDPHPQPPHVGREVRVIHTVCGVPTACSARHRQYADDGLCRVDGTCGSVASEDTHVPPSEW